MSEGGWRMWWPVAMAETSGFKIKRWDLRKDDNIVKCLEFKSIQTILTWKKEKVKKSKMVLLFQRSSGWGTPIGLLPMASSLQQEGEGGGVKLKVEGKIKSNKAIYQS